MTDEVKKPVEDIDDDADIAEDIKPLDVADDEVDTEDDDEEKPETIN